MSGASLFARYAFPPNELGYCGPAGADVLVAHGGSDGADDVELARRARLFDGAWPYLEIVAAAAGMSDPLDERVVEAYWIGNELLELVDPGACAAELRSAFSGQLTSRLADADTAVPHHSFHVFAVYPWVSMLGRGNDAAALSVLEQCRIRWGSVVEVAGDRAAVTCEPLTLVEGSLTLGAARTETVRWSVEGKSSVAEIKPGDRVALHWDWVCDVLDARQQAALRQWSEVGMNGAAVNASAGPVR
jgi:Family of unknown function (DUF6390)